MSAAEKTEKPTPRRLREARRKGQIAVSRDLAGAVAFAAGLAALGATAESSVDLVRLGLRDAIDAATAVDPRLDLAEAATRIDDALASIARITLPVAGATAAAGALAAALETRGLVATALLQPKLERLDPIKGIKRLFSARTAVEFLKSWAKLLLVAAAIFAVCASHAGDLAGATLAGGSAPLALAWIVTRDAALATAGVLFAVGGADVLLQKRLHLRDLRMSRDEVRRDHKEEEGDPLIKGARREAHREIALTQMIAATRTASVLVVNPTHYAAALLYDESCNAPRVVAKGAGHAARQIRRAAESSGVAVVRNRPLARALVRLPVGTEIPEPLFEAVAEILAYVGETVAAERPEAAR